MDDLALTDHVQGAVIVTFDGHVLEVFAEKLGSTCRLVRGMLFVETSGPDRKGRHEVRIRSMPGPRGGGGATLFVTGEEWPPVQAWFADVRAALGA